LEYARYVMIFTTVPAHHFSTAEVLEWYRARWQIELVFKRLKTLAEFGALPKHDDQSARAWLYGKLLIALLGQKLERLGRDISPLGLPAVRSVEMAARGESLTLPCTRCNRRSSPRFRCNRSLASGTNWRPTSENGHGVGCPRLTLLNP
jgi:hypothetical protein